MARGDGQDGNAPGEAMSSACSTPLDDVRSVLAELLRLYQWRFRMEAAVKAGNFLLAPEVNRLLRQYGEEKKVAWEAARRVLLAPQSETEAPYNPDDYDMRGEVPILKSPTDKKCAVHPDAAWPFPTKPRSVAPSAELPRRGYTAVSMSGCVVIHGPDGHAVDWDVVLGMLNSEPRSAST